MPEVREEAACQSPEDKRPCLTTDTKTPEGTSERVMTHVNHGIALANEIDLERKGRAVLVIKLGIEPLHAGEAISEKAS